MVCHSFVKQYPNALDFNFGNCPDIYNAALCLHISIFCFSQHYILSDSVTLAVVLFWFWLCLWETWHLEQNKKEKNQAQNNEGLSLHVKAAQLARQEMDQQMWAQGRLPAIAESFSSFVIATGLPVSHSIGHSGLRWKARSYSLRSSD